MIGNHDGDYASGWAQTPIERGIDMSTNSFSTVVQFIRTLNIQDGGPAHNAAALGRALTENGFPSVRFVLTGSHRDSVPADRETTYYRQDMPTHRWITQSALEVRRSNFVILHGYYVATSLWGALIATVFGVPFAIVPHGVLTRFQRTHSKLKKAIFDFFAKPLYARAHFLAVGSQAEADEARDVWQGQICVTGVALKVPATVSIKSRAVDTPWCLLSLSRLAPKKRVDVSMAALASLRELGVSVVLHVAGEASGGEYTRLRDYARELDLGDSVVWHGLVEGDAKLDLLTQAHILVLPSEDENFGIGVVEALAHGTPVITTRAVAAGDFVRRSGAGVLIDAPSEDLLVEAVLDVLAKYSEVSDKTDSARRIIRQELSWEATARRWKEAMNN